MDVAKALKDAPNQKSVLTCLQDNHLGKWVRAHQTAEELDLNADQVRRAANVLHGKGYLEKKSEDTYIPFLPGIGVLSEGKKEQLLRENDVPKDKWDKVWRSWKKRAEEEGHWFEASIVWFRPKPEKLN